MSLPKLNSETFTTDITLPSTGKIVSIRPYKVKEEKVLLLAAESKNKKEIFTAMLNLLDACVVKPETFKASDVTTFDMEYLFLKIRCLSVGETAPVKIRCSDEKCNHENEVVIDMSDVVLENNGNTKEYEIVELQKGISAKLSYPKLKSFIERPEMFESDRSSSTYEFLEACIEEVLTEDEVSNFREASDEDRNEFIESLTPVQVRMISNYMLTSPVTVVNTDFTCEKCTLEQHVRLEGMQDFFS